MNSEIDQRILEALEANYVLNRRIYDTLMLILKETNEDLFYALDEEHDAGGFAGAEVFVHPPIEE